MPGLSHWHHRCNAKQCQASICMLRWQARPLPCPPCQSPPGAPGAPPNTAPGANATGALAASVPATTSPPPGGIGASDHGQTGFSPPFWWGSPARRGASPENWASRAGPATAGAGGCAMRPWPRRGTVNSQARWKRRTSPIALATRGKRSRAGSSPWGAARVGAASKGSPVGAIMTKIGSRSSLGAVARGQASSRRPALAPSRRGRRRPLWPCQPAVSSTRTRPAAPG